MVKAGIMVSANKTEQQITHPSEENPKPGTHANNHIAVDLLTGAEWDCTVTRLGVLTIYTETRKSWLENEMVHSKRFRNYGPSA